jgi:serine/threonine-protein kinase RIM15
MPKSRTIDDFDKITLLGSGAFGEVYLVKEKASNELFALKCLSKSFIVRNQKEIEIFREKLFLEYINDLSVVALHGTFQDEDNLYFLLEHLAGGDLDSYVQSKDSLPIEEVRHILAEIIVGLEALHGKGIVHRDLKLENLLISATKHVKFVDFGSADLIRLKGVNDELHQKYLNLRGRYKKPDDVIEEENVAEGDCEEDCNTHAHSTCESLSEVREETILVQYYNEKIAEAIKIINHEELLFAEESPKNLAKVPASLMSKKKAPIQKEDTDDGYYEALREQRAESRSQNRKIRSTFVGSHKYVSPEMLRGDKVDFSCDLWALGVIAYRLINGQFPFEEDSEFKIYHSISHNQIFLSEDMAAEAAQLLLLLLEKNPRQRGLRLTKEGYPDYQTIKSLPFFKEIDWRNIRNSKSPIQIDLDDNINVTQSVSDSILPFEKSLTSQAKKRSVILSGLVRKMKYVFLYNTRQLILYSDKSVEYLDPSTGVVKGKLKLTNIVNPSMKSKNCFKLAFPHRTFEFCTIDVSAEKWVEAIKSLQKV